MPADETDQARAAVWSAVERNIRQVRPDLPDDAVSPDVALRDLVADSMDRLDVVVGTLDDLGLELAADRVAGARDLGALVDALLSGVGTAPS